MKNMYYNLTTEEFEIEVTKVKDVIIEYLFRKDFISHGVYYDMTKNHGILIRKPSFFSHWWKSKKEVNVLQYIIVKQVNVKDPDKDINKTKPVLNVVDLDKKKEPEKE